MSESCRPTTPASGTVAQMHDPFPIPAPSIAQSLGTTGLRAPRQGLGCMRMVPGTNGDGHTPSDVIGRALDLGVTFLDTAAMYGDGRNERLVGEAIRRRRGEVVLCTKLGFHPWEGDTLRHRGAPADVGPQCDASLQRLGVDVIDLWYLHRRDPDVPIEETVGAMAAEVIAGKVRHLGLSEVSVEELRAAHATHPIAALQSAWSITERQLEEVLPTCAELRIGVVPYGPLGAGLLLGDHAVPDRPDRDGPVTAALSSLEQLDAVARRHGATSGQVALAWLQEQAAEWDVAVVPIPGTTRLPHLEQNVAALDLALDAADLAQLDGGGATG